MVCNNIKCRHYRDHKGIDHSSISSIWLVPTKLVSTGVCRYPYCKLIQKKQAKEKTGSRGR